MMNSTKISLWCADHLDAWVEMYFTDIGIELEMQLNLGSQIKRKILYAELKSSNVDIIRLNLDEMYNKLVPKFNMLEDVAWSSGRQSLKHDLLDALK